MINTATRILIVAALVALVHGGFIVVRTGGMPTEIRPPVNDLRDLPINLGRWTGTEVETDPEIMVATDAAVVVDRAYQYRGQTVILHTNVMTKYFVGLPHHPRHCYDSHGSRLAEERRFQLPSADIPVALMTMENQGQRLLVLYWYQLGDKIIHSGAEQRMARRELRGQETWPPLVKVLLQTPCNDPERDEAGLVEFAEQVYAWTKNLDRSPSGAGPAE